MTLREEIDALCMAQLQRLPNLDEPAGYNDKIQWLKLHDQMPEQVIGCDKLAVRNLVAERVGTELLVPLRYVGRGFGGPDRYPCIYKASHDSGSAIRVRSPEDLPAAHVRMARALARTYGVGKGEWAYRMLDPRVLAEQALDEPVIDYKFHCSEGRALWVQVIWQRGMRGGPAEAIFRPEGDLTDLHMDEKMRHVPTMDVHPGDAAWHALTRVARALSEGFRYVRVDLYWSMGQAWFGELTFWPRAGCYKSADEPVFGELLDIDTSFKRPAIWRLQ